MGFLAMDIIHRLLKFFIVDKAGNLSARPLIWRDGCIACLLPHFNLGGSKKQLA